MTTTKHGAERLDRLKRVYARLRRAAARLGIETEYWDALGQHRVADPEALARMIEALARAGGERTDDLVPRTCVIRERRSSSLHLDVASGHEVAWTISSDGLATSGTGIAPDIVLPAELAPGSYRLRAEIRDPPCERSGESTLLVAPERAWQGTSPRRLWALAVQLYGVRSHRNWGHGDFTDLVGLIDLAADLGAAGIGLNPLHALFDERAEASPYSPNSRQFLNPRYIDVEAVAEFPGLRAAGLEADIAALRRGDLVDYRAVIAAKEKGLRLAYEVFRRSARGSRTDEFDAFRRSRGALLMQFACFESMRSHFARPWPQWPAEWRTPSENYLKRLRMAKEEAVAYFEFVQWIAHQQLDHCRERAAARGLPIGLYLDVAIGARAEGFDAWSEPGAILPTVEIGAPPDMLNTAGQKWGLAGINPIGLEARSFEPFRRVLCSAMQYAGAIRLDHVMGLKRQFLVPNGMPAERGLYIRSQLDALLAITAQESVLHRCIVIGEDLGTVPENFRETLADWGIWSYQVMIFERGNDGAFRLPQDYRENALATFATHDLPTFAGWRGGADLALKRALGIDPGETDDERQAALAAFENALAARGFAVSEFLSVARYLAGAASRLVVVSMEDALGMAEQVNVPGTVDEHPNWRRRLPVALEDLVGDRRLAALADAMAAEGRSSRSPD